jgi:predicted metal-binding membrane protein
MKKPISFGVDKIGPTDQQIENAVATASKLMAEKLDAWILGQLTLEQLENCVKQFQAEIEKRNSSVKILGTCDAVINGKPVNLKP